MTINYVGFDCDDTLWQGVDEALREVNSLYQLLLITKGDLFDQESTA